MASDVVSDKKFQAVGGDDDDEYEGGEQQQEEIALQDDVPSIDPELLVKHPLQNSWALWFFKNDKSKDWTANLKLVSTFHTVEDFWALYNHIQPASRLQVGCDYSVFKEGIQPAWEDDRNKRGGRWLINLNKSQRQTDLDNFWLETLLCLIGEAFDEYSDDICGATINIRPKQDKLGVWTSDAQKAESALKIGRKLKERLNIPKQITLGYEMHSDSSSKAGSTTRSRYSV